MITIDALKELGVDTEEGLTRCMNNEAFYLRLVGIALQDTNFAKLRADIEAGNLQEAFESAHALKGMLGNVSLTNVETPVVKITEALRAKEQDADYAEWLTQMETELEKLRAL